MNWNTDWPTPQKEPEQTYEGYQGSGFSKELCERLAINNFPVTNDGLLMLWQQTKDILAKAKEDEMEIRKTAVKIYVPTPTEGTNTVELGSGYELKAVVKFNYRLAENDIVESCLDRIAAIGNEGKFIADRLVSWTPNFLITEYRALQEEKEKGNPTAIQILNIVSEMLTITDAAPSLDIKEPKKKK